MAQPKQASPSPLVVTTLHGVQLLVTATEYPASAVGELVIQHSEGRLEVVLTDANVAELAELFARLKGGGSPSSS